jgi:MoaA/NifB/PqqE/SkfB family radical SAM enzyme
MGTDVNGGIAPHTLRLREAANGCATPTFGPQSVGIVLTNACNLTCVSCWSFSPLRPDRPATSWMRQRLTRAQLQPLFGELRALQTERVIFTGGGEPLVHAEALDIFADAKEAGLRVTLISNLTLAADPQRLVNLGIDTVMANFSCGDPASYVAFHPDRTEADYHRVVDTIGALVAAGTEVKLVFVVCRANVAAVPAVLDLAAGWNVRVQFKLISTTEHTASLQLTNEERANLLARRAQLDLHPARSNLPVLWAELTGAPSTTETPNRFPIESVGCHAGTHYARITAAGDVLFCCNQHPDLAIGSLHDDSFTELWRSDRWAAVRRRLARNEYLPGCGQCGKFDLNTRVAAELVLVAAVAPGATE